jgi:hypothetical protein
LAALIMAFNSTSLGALRAMCDESNDKRMYRK